MKAPLIERFRNQPISLGMQSFSGNPAMVEILGLVGFDWVSLDMEHSATGFETIEHLARACHAADFSALVRVAENNPTDIMKALDRGVDGVIVPHITSAEELETAVGACRYAPKGYRGACTSVRSSGFGTANWQEYVEKVNRETVLVALVEDVAAIKNFDEILEVEGADVFWLGTRDLSQDMGLPDADLNHPEMEKIARDLCARANAKGKMMMCTVGPVLSFYLSY